MRYIIEINDLMNKIAELGEQLVIVDVRKNIDDRLIPGAVRIDVRRDLSGENEFFAAPEQIAHRLGELGINSIKTVVFIDDGSNRNSAKALFALYQLGHKGHLSILQGGYPSWQTAGITLELIERQPTTYDYTLRDDAVMSFEEVKDVIDEESITLIDSRSYERYAGIREPKYKKAGHIPSAVNFHATKAFDEAGKWRKNSELKEHFASLENKEKIIVSCGTGGSACLNAIALLEAGYENVSLYPGGYFEWLEKGEDVATVKELEKGTDK